MKNKTLKLFLISFFLFGCKTIKKSDKAQANLAGDNTKREIASVKTRASFINPPNNAQRIIEKYKKGKRDFSGWNLEKANFANSDLEGINLAGANLTGANLTGANLKGADLIGANLTGVILAEADLRDSNLRGANLKGAVYNSKTIFPVYFDPGSKGMILQSE